MQNQKKNILSLSLIVALLAVIVGGTYAYFTDTTDPVTNTFTVGNVQISLDEAQVERVDNKFNSLEERTDKGVEYEKIYPGAVLPKDPTVTFVEGSEDSYVFMKLTNGVDEYIEDIEINEDWKELTDVDNVYVYKDIVNDDTDLPALFEEVKVKTGLSYDELSMIEELKIEVTAYAIQSEGFEDFNAAWEALDNQLNP